jgi:hypothetical protein
MTAQRPLRAKYPPKRPIIPLSEWCNLRGLSRSTARRLILEGKLKAARIYQRSRRGPRQIIVIRADHDAEYLAGCPAGGPKRKQPEYHAWRAMNYRCTAPHHPLFKYYGARGISVCDRWLGSYENFLTDMGHKPSPSLLLTRIDMMGNYEPGNCRWATKSEQNRRRRSKNKSRARGRS